MNLIEFKHIFKWKSLLYKNKYSVLLTLMQYNLIYKIIIITVKMSVKLFLEI